MFDLVYKIISVQKKMEKCNAKKKGMHIALKIFVR
jgi:hypothetical protein